MLSGAKLAPFFIAIGYFSNAFDGSPVALALSKVVGPNLSHLSWGLLFVIPVVIVSLALLGIHPLASITLLGQVLLTSQVTIPTLAIALALNVGGALSYLVSPFEGAIVLISDLADVPPTTVAIKYNGWFGLWFLLLSIVGIYFFIN
ncbi:hypothetical protein [Limosilactobacillus fermentum]|nr:hypothetical protein [Limosilactobacillus fermentum]MCD5423569.1 hypothetical protein [Limosilactobacillus fermentum]MPW03207.1 hypothetical protein [Limosilactobacillus fermentum]